MTTDPQNVRKFWNKAVPMTFVDKPKTYEEKRKFRYELQDYMHDVFKFENYKEVPIDKDKWDSLNRLLFDASRNDEGGERLRTLFSERSEEYKEEKLPYSKTITS